MAINFQQLILRLQNFWAEQGCIIQQPYDMEKGAGTFNPDSYLRALGPEPWRVAYVEPSRRPADGRYGENPNRLGKYFQFQVILKPSPLNIQELYLDSLRALDLDLLEHDIRFVEDNWESPTLGAWGLGWEVWADGMEVSQFTYFQQCGGIELPVVSGELTYGLERIAMYLQNCDNVYDLEWCDGVSYGDIRKKEEFEYSHYHFQAADTDINMAQFEMAEKECMELLSYDPPLVLPAYDQCIRCSHLFNIVDARGAISVTERQRYILRVRNLARACAKAYLEQREAMGFPLLKGEAREIFLAEQEAAAAAQAKKKKKKKKKK